MRGAHTGLLFATVAICLAQIGGAQTATFDFDGVGLTAGQSLPLFLASNRVTALFTSPAGGVFSLQSDATTHFRLSQFSGLYLYPNTTDSSALDIQFSQPLASITLVFATADFQQVEVPTTIQLTAYVDSTAAPAVGSTTAHGTYAGDTMPMGTLTFSSSVPFNVVRLEIPYQAQAASGFLVDNITVTPVATPQGFRVRKHLRRVGG
jgi:hypothetical protein